MQLAGGELPQGQGSSVADHLAQCVPCRTEWEMLRAGLEAIALLPRVAPPAEARLRLRAAIEADRNARFARRAWTRFAVAAAALLAALGAWVFTPPAMAPTDVAGVRWDAPDLSAREETHWRNGVDSGIADVWFGLRDLRAGKTAVSPVTPPEVLAAKATFGSDVDDGARDLRWEWDQDQEEGGFDMRLRDLKDSIQDLDEGSDKG